MKEVAIPLSVDDFKEYMSDMRDRVDDWKALGYDSKSIICKLAMEVSSEDPNWTYTSGQLREIFSLAK